LLHHFIPIGMHLLIVYKLCLWNSDHTGVLIRLA